MQRRIDRHQLSRLVVALAAVLAVTTAALAASSPAGGTPGPSAHRINVGVYSPQRIFRAYNGRQQLIQKLQGAEKIARAAQKTGDKKKEMAAEQTLRKKQMALIANFKLKMKKAIKKIAHKQNLDLVVNRIAFKSSHIATHDVTKDVIQQMNQANKVTQKRQPSLKLKQLP